MPQSTNVLRVLVLSGALAALAACSQYLDHRETITLNGGNSIAGNQVTQVVDPWPPSSANHNIAFNGERMQAAVQRYRTHRIIEPVGTGTSSMGGQGGGAQGGEGAANNTAPLGPQINQQATK